MNDELWFLTDKTRKNVLEHISSLNLAKPLTLKITAKKTPRSELQNRYLFGWIYARAVELLEDAGIQIPLKTGGSMPYTKKLLHEVMRQQYLMIGEIVAENGYAIPIFQSSADLDAGPFAKFCTKVKKFIWEFWQIQIPEPPPKSIYMEWARER